MSSCEKGRRKWWQVFSVVEHSTAISKIVKERKIARSVAKPNLYVSYKVAFILASISSSSFDWLFARDRSKPSRRNCLFHYHFQSFPITYQYTQDESTIFFYLLLLFVCRSLTSEALSCKLYIHLQSFIFLSLQAKIARRWNFQDSLLKAIHSWFLFWTCILETYQ